MEIIITVFSSVQLPCPLHSVLLCRALRSSSPSSPLCGVIPHHSGFRLKDEVHQHELSRPLQMHMESLFLFPLIPSQGRKDPVFISKANCSIVSWIPA